MISEGQSAVAIITTHDREEQHADAIAHAPDDIAALFGELKRIREVARVGWETARIFAVAHGGRSTEQRAIEALSKLRESAQDEPTSDGTYDPYYDPKEYE